MDENAENDQLGSLDLTPNYLTAIQITRPKSASTGKESNIFSLKAKLEIGKFYV